MHRFTVNGLFLYDTSYRFFTEPSQISEYIMIMEHYFYMTTEQKGHELGNVKGPEITLNFLGV